MVRTIGMHMMNLYDPANKLHFIYNRQSWCPHCVDFTVIMQTQLAHIHRSKTPLIPQTMRSISNPSSRAAQILHSVPFRHICFHRRP